MTKRVGARRPALFLLFAIALAAIVPTFATAQTATCPYYSMGTSGTLYTDGMMPPNYCGGPVGRPQPSASPGRNTAGSQRTLLRDVVRVSTPVQANLPLVQRVDGHTYSYVALSQNGGYLINRDGTPWATVRYNKRTGTWDLTDPNGSGYLLLRVGPSVGSAQRPESR